MAEDKLIETQNIPWLTKFSLIIHQQLTLYPIVPTVQRNVQNYLFIISTSLYKTIYLLFLPLCTKLFIYYFYLSVQNYLFIISTSLYKNYLFIISTSLYKTIYLLFLPLCTKLFIYYFYLSVQNYLFIISTSLYKTIYLLFLPLCTKLFMAIRKLVSNDFVNHWENVKQLLDDVASNIFIFRGDVILVEGEAWDQYYFTKTK